ncbi:MAG: HmuY family protein [Owenweeksia sp.]
MKKFFIPLVIPALLSSCFKEDELIPRQEIFEEVGRVDMTSEDGVEYPKQVYFDISTNQVKAFNYRDEWDLALGCEAGKPNLFVNTSLLMRVAGTGSSQWGATFSTNNYEFQYERVDRFFDKGWLAGDFSGSNPQGQVFIIDLGRDLKNKLRGYRLLQITAYNAQSYTLRIATLDYSVDQTVTVPLNPLYNFVYLSFDDPNTVMELEPPKSEWDLWFTRYMERLYDGNDTLDYSVTGCLINPYLTSAAFLTDSIPFEQISLENSDLSLLSTRTSIIGHDWKFYDLDQGLFLVKENNVYLVQDAEGTTFKMVFSGFYDEAAHKGAVAFRFLPL